MTVIQCPCPHIALLFTQALEEEGFPSVWALTDDGPVVYTYAPSSKVAQVADMFNNLN